MPARKQNHAPAKADCPVGANRTFRNYFLGFGTGRRFSVTLNAEERTINGLNTWINEKIQYAYKITLREPDGSQTNNGQSVVSFKTREFILSGKAESGKALELDLGQNLSVTFTLTEQTPEPSPTEAD